MIIAGAFGTYIDVGSAMTIGLLPKIPLERISQVGNAAGRPPAGVDIAGAPSAGAGDRGAGQLPRTGAHAALHAEFYGGDVFVRFTCRGDNPTEKISHRIY